VDVRGMLESISWKQLAYWAAFYRLEVEEMDRRIQRGHDRQHDRKRPGRHK
jgi:hypothetical protein